MKIRFFSKLALILFTASMITSCETVEDWFDKDKDEHSGHHDKDKMSAEQKKYFDEGKKMGKADAKDGKKSKYDRHSDSYDKKNEKYFKTGYEEGFGKAKD